MSNIEDELRASLVKAQEEVAHLRNRVNDLSDQALSILQMYTRQDVQVLRLRGLCLQASVLLQMLKGEKNGKLSAVYERLLNELNGV